MNILAIPGKMPATEPWLKQIIDNLDWSDQAVTLHKFSAWDNNQEFDIKTEIELLPNRHYDTLITKSIGTLIALRAQPNITWDRLIFIGVALSLYDDDDRKRLSALTQTATPTLVIQETNDPFGSFNEINTLLGNSDNVTCIEVAGEHHQYKDTHQVAQIIKNWEQ
ncbi:alpha/beta family hydrolase [Photobacterium leiognathi]|uniref:alpha/beta family hydrolase n=1 Tax=Photobacterium leiognathi TaxID=553611 RepID=UPI0029820E4B|nr:alpha/beta family hydrolase [Photobacterium leiognathi]